MFLLLVGQSFCECDLHPARVSSFTQFVKEQKTVRPQINEAI